MIDYSKFNLNKQDIDFLSEIKLALSKDCLNEVHLIFNKTTFSIEPLNDKIVVFYKNDEYMYNSVDEMLVNFKLNDKLFIEQLNNIELDYIL